MNSRRGSSCIIDWLVFTFWSWALGFLLAIGDVPHSTTAGESIDACGEVAIS
jgi:hypothetical protein